jgi:hypothetical protein
MIERLENRIAILPETDTAESEINIEQAIALTIDVVEELHELSISNLRHVADDLDGIDYLHRLIAGCDAFLNVMRNTR